MKIEEIESPAVLIDADRLEENLRAMQVACDAQGVELWPHIKTHKMVSILRRQLELGAKGATCAKLGEAEAMLPSGVRRIFIAHSLVDLAKAARLKALRVGLDQLILAVTSSLHCDALERLLASVDLSVDVLMAVNTGLDREGVRTAKDSAALAAKIRSSHRMNLIGLYTHEGQTYAADGEAAIAEQAKEIHRTMLAHAREAGGRLPLWPGCSVTARHMVGKPSVQVVRPGAYVFNDLALSDTTHSAAYDRNALSVLTTVVDRPEPGLALIDAGSKVFSGDKTPAGRSGRGLDRPSLVVRRVNEEHGYLEGEGVDGLTLGDRLRFIPAHVCAVVNLVNRVHIVRGDEVTDVWDVDARGRSD